VSVAPPCCETASTTFDAAGDAIVTIHGNNGAVNVTYTGPVGRVAVTSGGTLLAGGTTAYTNKTADPMVVEFYAGPQPTSSPIPAPSGLTLRRCIDVFKTSPLCVPLPAKPAIAPNSAAWAKLLFQAGHNSIGSIGVGSQEESEPLVDFPIGAPFVSLPMDCSKETYSAGTCASFGNPNGSVQQIPTNIEVSQGSDHHAAIDSHLYGGEFEYWLAPYPSTTAGNTWAVGGAGFCPWSGTGTNCSGSTATNIAYSFNISQAELSLAEASPNGALPYALGVSVVCADPSFVAPAVSSDGANTNTSTACIGFTGAGQRPPEGTRFYIPMTDAQINATNNLPYVRAILRTLDEQHMGGIIVDTNWAGAPGIAVQYRMDSFAPQAAEAGITGTSFSLPITNNGVDLTTIVFCANGSC
jgi:hypothetical protein